MNKKVKKYIILFIILIIVTIAILYVSQLRNKDKVKKSMEGVVISKDTGEVLEHIKVTINGKFKNNGDTSVFLGEMSINNLEYTQSEDAFLSYSVGYGEDGWKKRGILIHPTYIWKEGKLYPHHAMTTWVDMDMEFTYLVLANYEEDGILHDSKNTELVFNGTDIMVFPASDAESALKILKEQQIDESIFDETRYEDNRGIEIP